MTINDHYNNVAPYLPDVLIDLSVFSAIFKSELC